MAAIVLVTGGGRSGKSAWALRQAERLAGPRAFVATCPVLDDEMRRRIERHREERKKGAWDTIEEPVHLPDVFRKHARYRVMLVDCLTLWLSNLMYEAEKAGGEMTESDAVEKTRDLLDAIAAYEGTAIIVTNEVGLGIIPANAAARRFRDIAGRANQIVAAAADCVVFMVCGLPMVLKGAPPAPRE
jgi:adenosylcobinamide kinase/adenosylcobinamide-phosphate guanylyltransferase